MRVRGQLRKHIIKNITDLTLIVFLHSIYPSRISMRMRYKVNVNLLEISGIPLVFIFSINSLSPDLIHHDTINAEEQTINYQHARHYPDAYSNNLSLIHI